MATSRVFVVFVLFLLSIHHSHSQNRTVFIFGDSLHDYGNTMYFPTITFFQGNFYPYGITFFNFPTGRISDGRLIPDIISILSYSLFQPSYFIFSNNNILTLWVLIMTLFNQSFCTILQIYDITSCKMNVFDTTSF